MSDDDAPASEETDEEDWFERALDPEDRSEDLFTDEWAIDDDEDVQEPPSESDPADPSADGQFDQDANDLEAAFDDISASYDGEFDTAFDQNEEIDFDAAFDDFDTTTSGVDDRRPDDEDYTGVPASGAESNGERRDVTDDTTDSDVTDDGSTDDEADGLFDRDFGTALSDAPDLPGEGGSSGSRGEFPDVGEEFDLGGEFDMETDDRDALSDSGFGSPASAGFDEEEADADSEIDRIKLGVDGLDAMIQGGVPERALMVAIGSAGTGKTTLGLQFLNGGLEAGERAVYITLEESRQRVIRSATEKGFGFDEYAANDQLAVVDMDPVEMANSLQSIRNELPRLIDEFGASRLVLDSVSLLEMMYDDRATRRNEIYDFTKSLKEAGVTTLMTSEADAETPYASRHGIVEYLTDAVFVLQYVRPSDFRETRLAIEIQKIRDANHSRETKPYEITNEGINVYRQANIF